MADKILHAIDIKSVIANSIVGIIFGLVLTFVPVSTIAHLIIVLVGLYLIVNNGFSLYKRLTNKEESSNEMLFDVLGVFAGFVLLAFGNLVVTIIVAIYLVAKPIIQLVMNKFDKQLAMQELPKIILGVILLISGLSVFDVIFRIVGIFLLVCSLAYLGINYFLYKKSGVKIVK